jgi:hypothetical protein
MEYAFLHSIVPLPAPFIHPHFRSALTATNVISLGLRLPFLSAQAALDEALPRIIDIMAEDLIFVQDFTGCQGKLWTH